MPSQAYLDLLAAMADLHVRKSAGYSGADQPDAWHNFRQCEKFGISTADGIITRMSDKWSRIQALWRDPANEQVGEALQDTLKDLASYALILVCLLNEDTPPPAPLDLRGLTYYPNDREATDG